MLLYREKKDPGRVSESLFNYCSLGTSDFDGQMSGIKVWKGDEILSPVLKTA
jgi:hypothetical protein